MATLFRRQRSKSIRGFYYSRLIIPTDIRPVIGRREVLKCLRTPCYKEARTKAAQWEGRLANLFSYLRQHQHSMKPDQLRQLVQRHMAQRLEEWEESVYGREQPASESMTLSRDDDGEPTEDQWQESLAAFSKAAVEDSALALKQNNLESIAPTADEFIKRYKLAVQADSALYRLLCRELLKAEQAISREIKERVQGNFNGQYLVKPAPSDGDEVADAVSTLLFSKATAAYFRDFPKQAPRTKTEKEHTFRRFLDVLGEDRPLYAIRKADCLKYRETLRQMPTHAAKRYPGKALAEVLEAVQASPDGVELLSTKTVNQSLIHLSHFFGWAERLGYYKKGENPVDGLLLAESEEEESSYDPFADEDLRKIFGERFVKQRSKHPERYFIPLALLYTGARREEVAQLAVASLKDEHGIWYFDIAPDPKTGKRLKNRASVRRVPLHSHLIRLGFLDYAKTRKKEGHADLFPKLRNEGKGRASMGDAVGKWFKRHLETVGVRQLGAESGKVIHSFRKTVTNKLYELNVEGELARKLLGHSPLDVHEQTYLKPELLTLQERIERLDFRTALAGLFKSC